MRRHRFDELLPDDDRLPPPAHDYTEREIAHASGHTWREWTGLSAGEREQVIAHELHKNMRETYMNEKLRANSGKKKKGGGVDPLDRIMATMAKTGSALVNKK